MSTALDRQKADVEIRFTSHPPQSWQIQRMQEVRATCTNFALWIVENVPAGRDQALALTHLEETMFAANAGISRPSQPPAGDANAP